MEVRSVRRAATYPAALAALALAAALFLPSSALADPEEMTRDDIICLARSGVGFSYWWGHGCWCNDNCEPDFSCSAGSCSGSCPSCTHTGSYGADCSGFAAKVWQVPNPIDLSSNAHPYSTLDFRCSSIHWNEVDKGEIERADALVYRNGGCPGSSGHIMIYESGDPWGDSWTYEARGCSIGIVHNNRSVSSSYIAIRRNNLAASCVPTDEVCDGADNDCDGSVDEDYTPYTCGTGSCERDSTCTDGVEACTPGDPEPEVCDGVDNDCDGETDEDGVCTPDVEDVPEVPDADDSRSDDLINPHELPDISPDGSTGGIELRGLEGGCGCAMIL